MQACTNTQHHMKSNDVSHKTEESTSSNKISLLQPCDYFKEIQQTPTVDSSTSHQNIALAIHPSYCKQ